MDGIIAPAPAKVPTGGGKPITPKVVKVSSTTIRGANIKVYLPPTKGCSAVRVPARRCWTVYYPGKPASRTRTWGWAMLENRVLLHVLTWAWRRHREEGGGQCPFKFEVWSRRRRLH